MGRDASGRLLVEGQRTLPSRWYFDPDHYRRELEAIWCRTWLCVGRAEEIARPRDFLVAEVGNQSLVVTRDLAGRLHAYHNTCRHRGSLLCSAERGRFRGASIVCPYHGWTYALSGELLGARHQLPSPHFRKEEYPLYRVAVDEWAGYLFVNLLGDESSVLADALGTMPRRFASWHVDELRVGRRAVVPVACNWKVFWENFSECFHCPGVHPELSRLVPAYGRGLVDDADGAAPPEAGDEGDVGPRLAPGAVTWTLDGTSRLPALPGLSEEERRRGQSFAVLPPSVFLVAHVDYVRSVRVLPRGPEATELVVEWLFPPEVIERSDVDLEHAVALGRLVVEQDGRVCELNQKGLHCLRHESGVLVPQEYGVREFQEWVRNALEALP